MVGITKIPIYLPYNWIGNAEPFPLNFHVVAVFACFQSVPVLSYRQLVHSSESHGPDGVQSLTNAEH